MAEQDATPRMKALGRPAPHRPGSRRPEPGAHHDLATHPLGGEAPMSKGPLWYVEAKRYVTAEFLVRADSEEEARADADELAMEMLDDSVQEDTDISVSSWSGTKGAGLILPIWSGNEDGDWEAEDR